MQDRGFADTLRRLDLRIQDGIGLVLMARLLGKPISERVSGSDLLLPLADIAARHGLAVILLGNDAPANLGARTMLLAKHPNLTVQCIPDIRVERTASGWNLPQEAAKALKESGPCIVMCGLGMQKQEEWMLEHLRPLPNMKIAIGCGGAFAMLAGSLPRAPRFMRHCGLEWLWRLWLEPKRLIRILRAVFVFPVRLLIYEMRKTK